MSWKQSPSVLIQGNVETTDLKYPAVTLCPKVTTRWGIVERLGNYLDPLNLPKEFLSLRHDLFLCASGLQKKVSSMDESSKKAYKYSCDEYSRTIICKVCNIQTIRQMTRKKNKIN